MHHAFNLKKLIVILAIVALASTGLVKAAEQNVSIGTAVVDGAYGEWDLEKDFFANMIRAAGHGGPEDILSKLYLRYDPNTETLFVLVLVVDEDMPAIKDTDDENAWVRIDGQKKVDSTYPSFEWVELSPPSDTYAEGYEASFHLKPGSYIIRVHVQVYDPENADDPGYDGETSGTIHTGTPITVIPELPLIGTIGAMIAMLTAVALKMRRKQQK